MYVKLNCLVYKLYIFKLINKILIINKLLNF
jgi:hypothetical protein